MGQGIDTWASLRAACQEYNVPMNIPALVDAVAERARGEALQVRELEAARLGRRATLDPGAFVKRQRDAEGEYERLDQWQDRALLAALGARF